MRPLQILLTEDHGDSAKAIKRLLEPYGHTVEIAADVATVLELAGRRKFDLLLSDIGLPDGSGLDLVRRCARGDSSWPSPSRAMAMSRTCATVSPPDSPRI